MPPRYTDEFKMEAVKQVTVNGYSINETAESGCSFRVSQELDKKVSIPRGDN